MPNQREWHESLLADIWGENRCHQVQQSAYHKKQKNWKSVVGLHGASAWYLRPHNHNHIGQNCWNNARFLNDKHRFSQRFWRQPQLVIPQSHQKNSAKAKWPHQVSPELDLQQIPSPCKPQVRCCRENWWQQGLISIGTQWATCDFEFASRLREWWVLKSQKNAFPKGFGINIQGLSTPWYFEELYPFRTSTANQFGQWSHYPFWE